VPRPFGVLVPQADSKMPMQVRKEKLALNMNVWF
jgi:hypothetical protein